MEKYIENLVVFHRDISNNYCRILYDINIQGSYMQCSGQSQKFVDDALSVVSGYKYTQIGDSLFVRNDIYNNLKSSYFLVENEDRSYYLYPDDKMLYFYFKEELYIFLETYYFGYTIIKPEPERVRIDMVRNNLDLI